MNLEEFLNAPCQPIVMPPVLSKKEQKALNQKAYRNRLKNKGLTEHFTPTYESRHSVRYQERPSKYANDEEYKKAKRRSVAKHRARTKYGLTLEAYEATLSRGCEVCGSTLNVCVDHDHTTGKVRGCLCKRCNSTLGHLLDDHKLVENLYNYMVKNNG